MLELDRPLCEVCKVNVTSKLASGNYRKKCRRCGSKNGRATGKISYRALKKDFCENVDCPIPMELVFTEALELHHLVGKHDDGQSVTLCVFCHRKATKENRDWVNVRYRNE